MYSREFYSISLIVYPSNIGYFCVFLYISVNSIFSLNCISEKIVSFPVDSCALWSILLYSYEFYSIYINIYPKNLGYFCVFLYIPLN